MDGRDCGPPRSVHIPPPLLTGLAMESHRLGAAAAAGRIPPSPGHLGAGHSASLHSGKYLSSAINIRSHHGDAFQVGSSPFLGGYVSSSNPHGGPAPMTSDPSFRAPNPTNLQMAQLWASHLHEGFAHLPGSLYPSSYIPLGHLEHPSSGSPLHAQLGQHPLFEPPKEGFYLPGHGGPSALHAQSALSRTPAAHTPSSLSRDREALPYHRIAKDMSRDKERLCKAEPGEPHPRGPRDGDREEPRPRSVVDLTEDERRTGGPHRPSKKASPFFREPSPGPGNGELKLGAPLQTSSLSNCRSGGASTLLRPLGPEQDRWPRDPIHDDENTRPGAPPHGDRSKKYDPAATSSAGTLHGSRGSPSPHGNTTHLHHRLISAGTYPPPPLPRHLPPSLYPLYPTVKDPGREHRVIAPTFVPSVELYDERVGPIQIASQARENKSSRKGERDSHRQTGGERTQTDLSRPPAAHEPPSHDVKGIETFREEGSVIRSNCIPTRRPPPLEMHADRPGRSPDTDSVLTSASSKELSKSALEAEYRSQDRNRIQRASMREGGLKYGGVDSTWMHPEQPSPKGFISTEHKWNPFDMADYASGQMSALVAQHGQGHRGEEDGKNAYMDPSGVHRPAPSGSSRGSPKGLHPEPHREVSAMQSLIKYSGSFTKGPGSRPGSDGKGPFAGLGCMKLEGGQPAGPKTQHFPPQQSGKQLKRDPERPESAKSFGRESIGSQGEVEVRHPPVGIAVAVARQRDNGSKPGLGPADRERPLMGGIKGSGRPEEDRGDEGIRDDRLLQGRLEREQEKLLRENKELADYTHMHLPEATANGLNPNLMVTGGPPLVSSGRWPPDPASHLVSHPWMPRPSGPSMWPYGLGPPSLHQGLPPGYPPTLPGSIPPPYQFARDPQSGQLLVIPTEHLPHYAAELMERSPPLWPSLYPSASSSLQHAQELHLLSQQQLLRQQELLMIQQQAAQVMELQRSAQLAERLKASEHRAEMEEKAAKRSADGGKHGVSARPGPALHSRKPAPARTPTPTASYRKALTPLPSPPKTEKSLPERSYSHPSTPAPRLPSPASAPPPLAAPIPPKEECVDVCENKELDLQNHVSAPLQALYPEIPPGYPYQSLTAPFGSHYPYLLQPAAAADADGLAPDVPLPAETPERSAAPADVKPRRLRSPAAAGPPPPRGEHPTLSGPAVKEEPGLEEVREHPDDPAARLAEIPAPALSCRGEFEAERRSVVVPTPAEGPAVDELADGGRVKLEETALLNCRAPYQGPDADTALPETEPPVLEGSTGPEGLTYHPSACSDEPQALVDPASPEPEETEPELDSEQPLEEALEVAEPAPETPSPPPHGLPGLSVMDVALDDPMAGMIALVAASELPQACLLPGSPSELTPLGCSGLEGMTLLGEVAELELERQHSALLIAGPCGLETLLLASRQVLLEELQRPVVTIRLPRELKPNRRYSWMQKKEEPLFSKSALEGMDILEVDYRMRLAELQRRYKDRQRELAKLQRHREREEKLLLEESSRASARRGPGRPRKRKHSLTAPSPPAGKLDARNARFSKSLPLSEDSEAGEILRKRFRGPSLEEDEEMDGAMKVKRKNKQWGDREASSSFSQEMPMKSNKKRRVSEQEQLASKLDRALSLTKLGKLHRSPFQYAEGHCGRATPGSGSCGKFSALREMELKAKAGKQSLSKGLGLFQKSSKGGKNKMAAKTKNTEPCMNVKGQQKALYSPVRSEVSSYSNNTDTEEEEEEEEELMEGWPPRPALSRTGARPLRPALCSKASNKSWPLSKRGGASGGLHPQRALGRTTHKHFGLLLREAGASSSEDSFDQEYFTEKEDYEDEEEEEDEDEYGGSSGLCSPSVEESGLGLLARFAASALPCPLIPAPLSVVQLEAKQKARKKEERQSLLGTEFEYTDSENDVKIRKRLPSLLHGKRSAPELPLLAPASALREEPGPLPLPNPGPGPGPGPGRPRKAKKTRPPRALSLDTALEASDEDHWARRRSERIFLHDAAVTASSTPVSPTAPLPKPARCPKKEAAKPKEAKDVAKKKKGKDSPVSLSPPPLSSPAPESRSAPPGLPVSPVRRGKAKAKPREVKKEQVRGKGGAVSKLMESMAADEDFEPSQDSSFSEDENVPLSAPPDRPSTPGPRNCVIQKEELQDGLRVLIPMDDKLLYAGHVNTVHSPDIYRVMVEGERGNRPHIYCLEQLLQEAIIDVKPPSVKYLPEGTRIAAYWSQQYRCLYPGTVVRGNPDMEEDDDLITVEFDDGDTGRIPLSHIRLLPPDYKIQCAEPSPALLVPSTKRRGRKSSKEAPESKEADSPTAEEPASKSRGRGRKPKPKPDSEVIPEEREKSEMSAPAEAQETPLPPGGSAPRPGRKRQQGNVASSSAAMPDEAQKKPAATKAAAKANPQPQKAAYTSPIYGKVLSVNLYNEPSISLGSFLSGSSVDLGKTKPAKKGRKSDEVHETGPGAKVQRKPPQAEVLIKLDHEGVMSPKTKKTKALMMMEDKGLDKRQNKAVMGVAYTTVPSGEAIQKPGTTKAPEKENPKAVAVSSYRKLSRGGEAVVKVPKVDKVEESDSSSSTGSESEGEAEEPTKEEEVAREDAASGTSRASSPVSTNSSSSSTNSSSTSSSSGSGSTSSSSSSSSSASSTTTDEDSPCSSDEETAGSPQNSSSSAIPQSPPEAENKLPDAPEAPSSVPTKGQRRQQAKLKEEQSKSRPKRREGIHLPTTKELAKRQRLPSVENRPKISAFLPARQLWKWFGKPTQRRGMKGKAKKLFYKAIMRGKEMISIGDCAVFLSAGRPNLPYIGHIQSMWESWGSNMVVRVKWFYHPEETNPGKKLHDGKAWDPKSVKGLHAALQASNQRKDFMERALYQSSHIDENDVQTISHKCLVVSLEQYEQMIKTKKYQDSEDLYYLAGTYEPTTGMIFNTDGVPIIC